jgi:membrane-bound lytic murein transglycosylase D
VHRFAPSLLTRSILCSFHRAHLQSGDVSPSAPRTKRGVFLTALFVSLATAQASAQLAADLGAAPGGAAPAGVVVAVTPSAAVAVTPPAVTPAVTISPAPVVSPATVTATRGQSSTPPDASVNAPALAGSAMVPTAAPAPAAPGVVTTSAGLPSSVVDAPLIGVVGEIVTDAPPADIWDRVRAGYAMEDLDDPLVAKWEKYYADRPDYVARIVERSSKYMFYIVTELERRGMPLEIALLPMIESAFNPVANSSAKASGIWQFMPSTGVNYGMKQDWWSDSRRDIVKATNGAIDYLSKLHGMFGDWQLALASYNWGEGSVGRAVQKSKAGGGPGNYLALNMPAETRNYLPKLQAVKNIIRNPAAYGLTIASVPNEPYFKTITLAHAIDMKRAAQLAEMTEAEFVALNPAHNRPVIGGRSEYQVLLPAAKADSFLARLESNEKPRVSWMAYRTRIGDRMEALAARFGTSVAALKSVNGIRSVAPSLPAGYHLLVPSDGPSEDALGSIQNAVFTKFPEYVAPRAHTVRRGENFASIAKRYGVKPATLAQWNRMSKPSARAGQVLYVSGPAPVRSVATKGGKAGRVVYVKRGGKSTRAVVASKRVAVKKTVKRRR